MNLPEALTEVNEAMLSYTWASSWGLAMLISAVGWGSVVGRVLYPARHHDIGHLAVWGLSLQIIAGGVMNLMAWATAPTLMGIVGLGLVLFVVEAITRRKPWMTATSEWISRVRAGRVTTAVLIVCAFLLLARFAVSVSSSTRFNPDDDMHGYMVYPSKIVQLGTMGDDPFSYRRCVSGLGGSYFLNAIVLSALSHENLQILDNGLGLLILFASFAGLCREQNLPLSSSLVPMFLIAFVPPPQANLSSLLLISAFIVSMVRLMADVRMPGGTFSIRNTLLMALIAAAACTLKSPAMIGAGVLFGVFYLVAYVSPERRAALISTVVFGLAFFAFLFPYMAALRESSGSWLYPVFGKGYDTMPPPNIDMQARSIVKVLGYSMPFFGLLVLFFVYSVWCRPRYLSREFQRAVIALLACAAFGALLLGFGTGGFGFARYPYGFTFPALVVVLTLASLAYRNENNRLARAMAMGIGVMIASALFSGGVAWGLWRHVYRDSITDLRTGLAGQPLFSAEERSRTVALQNAIPPNAPFFAVVDRPSLLNWRRNPIYHSDWIGCSSLPPHMPVNQGPDALREYLLGQSVRYVAFAYSAPWGHGREEPLSYINSPGTLPWLRIVAERCLDTTDNMMLLASRYRRIYDDQEAFVLDLQTPQ